jgi:hypothetical protein
MEHRNPYEGGGGAYPSHGSSYIDAIAFILKYLPLIAGPCICIQIYNHECRREGPQQVSNAAFETQGIVDADPEWRDAMLSAAKQYET